MGFFRLPFPVPALQDLAIPAVCSLVFFLAYSSQYLFYYIEPGPLSKSEAIWFNVFVVAIWLCYDQACTVDPGRKGWVDKFSTVVDDGEEEESDVVRIEKGMRWCKKCDAIKPPRAHHCRKCGRCIPKMDHHCPWTSNCVSHTTIPHFIRFVFYCVISMSILAYHLFTRLKVVWDSRSLPAYLGPSSWALTHLFVLSALNSLTLLALTILFLRAGYQLIINTTSIESWEIERHEALVDRSRKTGGHTYGSGGQRIRIEHQEFPYDIGIWKNLCQAMGTANLFAWFLPFGGAPGVETASNWEVNGFEDESKVWPPPDPDKMPRYQPKEDDLEIRYETIEEEKEAFRMRQENDLRRLKAQKTLRELSDEDENDDDEYVSEYEEGIDGEPGWTNADGDRLKDYGVDEEAEAIADDDIPLGELLRRRRARLAE